MKPTDCIGQEINPGDYVVFCYVSNYAPTNRVGRVTSVNVSKNQDFDWIPPRVSVSVHSVAEPTHRKPEAHVIRSSVTDTGRLTVIPEALVPEDKKALLTNLKVKV